jgi:outer membrane protein assembly factor BamB
MPRDETVLLYIGIKGSVLALDRATGDERWRAKLKGMSFVALHRDDRYLYAATGGELFCLDALSGALVWRNPLKGLGFGLVTMLSDGARRSALPSAEPSTSYVTVAEELKRRQAAQHGGTAGA